MAQIALTYVGTAIGGPIGGAVGAVLGAWIDNVLFGSLFGPDDPEGPKVEDFRFSQVSEHSPMFKPIGPFNRVPGTYIWLSNRKQKKKESDSGGKGGGTTITTYKFFFDMAVSVGEAPYPNGVSGLRKVWGNSKVLWGFNEGKDATSNAFVCTTEDELDDDGFFLRRVMRVTSPDVSAKLNKFKSGVDCTMSNWPNSNNNGTFRVLKAGKDASGDTFLDCENDFAVAEAATPNGVNITQGLPQLQANGASDFVFYDGSSTQAQSPLIVAAEGVNLTPAYRGTAYFTFEDLAVNQFGNIPPQITALVEEAEVTTDADALERLLSDAGFSASEIDTTAIGQVLIDGYHVRGPQEVKAQLHPVMIRADVLAQDRAGTLAFFYRKDAARIDVRTDDLAAHETGRDAPRPMDVTDVTEIDLPTDLNLRYHDAAFNYQGGSARAQKLNKPRGVNVRDINLPIVMLGEEAQDIARRLLWSAHANRHRVSLALPPRYLAVQENDRLVVEAFGTTWEILLERVTVGSDFVVECDGLAEVPNLYLIDNSSSDDPTDPEPIGPYVPPECELHLMDLPPLREEDATVSGVYSAIAAFDPLAQFIGAAVYSAAEADGNFSQAFPVDVETVMGRAKTAQASPPAHTRLDRGTVLQVELINGVLSSKPLEDVLAGGFNVFLWGNEIIGVVDVELTGPRTYDLTNLLRGLFDTEDHMVHAVGERFVYLNDVGVGFQATSSLVIGNEDWWKVVPADGDVTDFGAIQFANLGQTLKPYSVVGVRSTQVVGGTITITWSRRTRVPQPFAKFKPIGDLDPDAGHEIDILNAPGGSVVRTLVVTDAQGNERDYTNADQVTDFGSTQSTIHVVIYKMSVTVGRGNPRAVSLTPQQV